MELWRRQLPRDYPAEERSKGEAKSFMMILNNTVPSRRCCCCLTVRRSSMAPIYIHPVRVARLLFSR